MKKKTVFKGKRFLVVLSVILTFGIAGSLISFTPGHIPTGVNCDMQGMSSYIKINGVGHLGQGAGVAYGDINRNGKLDMMLMAYDNPAGANTFRYKIGWDINFTTGIASSWTSGFFTVPGVGNEGNGAGVCLFDIDDNGVLDVVFMAYDDPAGGNSFRYKIGWNINTAGVCSSWGAYTQIAGAGDKGSGAGVAIADINQNGTPDMVLMACNEQDGTDQFSYKIGWDIDAAGISTNWTTNNINVGGVGSSIQGADIAIADVNLDGELDMILMAYDNPLWNNFRYKIGWSLKNNGRATDWSRYYAIKGFGQEGDGSGISYLFHPSKGPLLTLMAYDDPSGQNNFRYSILPITSSGATFGIADDPPPSIGGALQVPTGSSTFTPARLFNLNMREVQDAANDAITGYLFGCLVVGLLGDTPTKPVCWCTHPDYETNNAVIFSNGDGNYDIMPDVLAAAIAWYVSSNMGYVTDNINSWVLNDYHGLGYYRGAETVPAYYIIHYTNPNNFPGLLPALDAKDTNWCNAYDDGMLYHGDCEDFAVMRHALLRALGFDRDFLWTVTSPGHQFNVVLYNGAYRIMDYGYIYQYFCKPSGITSDMFAAWNMRFPPSTDGKYNLQNYVLNRAFPDRCGGGLGWLLTRRAHSEYLNDTKCCD